MTIKFNPDHLSIAVDLETYHRLSCGTPFQQSMNLLALLLQIMAEADQEILDNAELTPKQRNRLKKILEQSHHHYLRQNPPPGIDAEALRLFCD